LFEDEEDLLIGARRSAPQAIGYDDRELYLGSDALAPATFTDRIAYLEEARLDDADRHAAVGKGSHRRFA
jgi:glucosamine 6-phosphate synthetase-like amidotransferase/phosphosugar isomerase protein